MALISQNTVLELVKIMLDSGIDTLAERRNFFLSVDKDFFGILVQSSVPRSQLQSDIGRMNEVERLADGQIPLLIYLQNVASFLIGFNEELKVRQIIDQITHKTSGVQLPNLKYLPELKEAIVHTDDTVTFQFMQAGVHAAASVAKLLVPSYLNGSPRLQGHITPMVFLGTCWLLTNGLLVTNHHVINARMDNEGLASIGDLMLQGSHAKAIFDFNSEGLVGIEIESTELVAWDSTLDYAILRIPDSGRKPLRCIVDKFNVNSEIIPVNIIQHPAGKSKRFGIRNNLIQGATLTDLRYFTDTESGSSGAPVFTDQWQVIALHRAATYVAGVNFQGKNTAYVNIGTRISLILDDVKNRFPSIAAELSQF